MIADRLFRKRKKTSGQAIVLIAGAFIVLVLFLGLVVDLGQIFIAQAYLRKATDASSLAAAAQFRQGRTASELDAAARQIIIMNGLNPSAVLVQTCATNAGDPELCATDHSMPKKLVRVKIDVDYPLTFLRLLHIDTVHLSETSVSEAASLDVVLVLDKSESMTWDGLPGDQQDPSYCNPGNSCKPFFYVKDSAKKLVDKILNKSATDEEDRMALVTIADNWHSDTDELATRLIKLNTIDGKGWTTDNAIMKQNITDLNVYDPGVICPYGGPPTGATPPDTADSVDFGLCRYYDTSGKFQGLSCMRAFLTDPADPAPDAACDTTNIGGALDLASGQFGIQERDKALWIVILLTDGGANATPLTALQKGMSRHDLMQNTPLGLCPPGARVSDDHHIFCQDGLASTKHDPGDAAYDADDYARNSAFNLGDAVAGTHAIIFTIGLGDASFLNKTDEAGVSYGGSLLRYVADIGYDGKINNDTLCNGQPYAKSCGNYFYSSAGSDLWKVFQEIASRIFTRLSQ
jgi:hypothetical protein